MTLAEDDDSASSEEFSFSSDKRTRRPKRKKDGEIANKNIDPAVIYAQELKKQQGKKAFTVAILRKEMDDLIRKRELAKEKDEAFGKFGNASTAPGNINADKSNNIGKSLEKGGESVERPRPGMMASSRSVRSLFGANTNKAAVPGARRTSGLFGGLGTLAETIDEGNEDEEDFILTGGINSEDLDKDASSNQKSGMTGGKSLLKAFSSGRMRGLKKNGAKSIRIIKNTFKGKVPIQFEKGGGGGLLNEDRGGDSDDNEDRKGNRLGSFESSMPEFIQQDPLPVPEPQEEEDDTRFQRANHMLGKMNVKSKRVISKLKMPGKNIKSVRFGGGIMMHDDDGY